MLRKGVLYQGNAVKSHPRIWDGYSKENGVQASAFMNQIRRYIHHRNDFNE